MNVKWALHPLQDSQGNNIPQKALWVPGRCRALFAYAVSKSFRPLLGMQMNGIHVTSVIKGSCLSAKHWNTIWQFCWRQQAQKNNHHLPQKSRSLGREGEECRAPCSVCSRLVLLKTCSSPEWERAGSQSLEFCKIPLLPVLCPAEQPWHSGQRLPAQFGAARATNTELSIHPHPPFLCLATGRLLLVCTWSPSVDYRERHKTSSSTLQGVGNVPLMWLLPLHFLHTHLEHSERNSVLVWVKTHTNVAWNNQRWCTKDAKDV